MSVELGLNLPVLIAHRGASAYAPENTLPAMRLAKAMGARWVEFDVTLSADGVPLVFHDKSLRRTTSGSGTICKKPATVLAELDAGAWYGSQYSGTKIPTLRELLLVLAELGLHMNLEIKPHDARIAELVSAIKNEIDSYWPKHLAPPLFSSFSHQALIELRRIDSQATTGFLMHSWRNNWQEMADKLGCVSVHLNRYIITPKRLTEIKSTGRFILSYTVNDKALAKDLFNQGVDGIFSDYPDLLKEN